MRRRDCDRPFTKPGAVARKRAAARVMRRFPTPAEAVLWEALRKRRVLGWKFRRQHVIAGYIVDFYCPALRLAIEVDGAVHETRAADDRARDYLLGAEGVHVIRVHNRDVLESLEEVIELVATQCSNIAAR